MKHTIAEQAANRSMGAEELVFHPSAGPTIGVELELMVLDPQTADLSSGAMQILTGCENDELVRKNVSAELMQSMIEVKTGVCQNVAEVEAGLLPVLRRLRNITRSVGYDLAMAGTHPFHRASQSARLPE